MREFKFRGKCINENAWAYGSLIQRSGRAFIFEEGVHVPQVRIGELLTEVIPESVGMFAFKLNLVEGEKELYEGDVIEDIITNKKYVIEWDSDYGTFVFTELDDKREGTVAFDFIEEYGHTNCYLFGNIIENPELLEAN